MNPKAHYASFLTRFFLFRVLSECILIATKQHDKLLSVQEYERGLALMNKSKGTVNVHAFGDGNSLASMRRLKSSSKEIETLQYVCFPFSFLALFLSLE